MRVLNWENGRLLHPKALKSYKMAAVWRWAWKIKFQSLDYVQKFQHCQHGAIFVKSKNKIIYVESFLEKNSNT